MAAVPAGLAGTRHLFCGAVQPQQLQLRCPGSLNGAGKAGQGKLRVTGQGSVWDRSWVSQFPVLRSAR